MPEVINIKPTSHTDRHAGEPLDEIEFDLAGPDEALAASEAKDVAPHGEGEEVKGLESARPQEDFETLVEDYMDKMAVHRQGEIIDARIVEVHREYALLDIGDKAEAIVNIAEFIDPKGEINVSVGDIIPVVIRQRDEETGLVEVSYRRARELRAWEELKRAHKEEGPVKGQVAGIVKGGAQIDVGVMAFCPASQVDLRRVENLETLVGETFEFLVLELNVRRGRVVLSRRAWLEAERTKKREQILSTLQEDQVCKVAVKNICDFGVFCDLGGIDGLIPREELSWDRGVRPGDVVVQGDEIRVRVMSVDREKGKITLSRRRTRPDPWEGIETRYPVDAVVSGKVVSLTNFGAFVHIEEGVTALLHVGDLSWDKGAKSPGDYLKVGDHVKVAVLEVNREKRQLAVGLKQITMDPWAEAPARFPVGSRHNGKVTSVVKFGVFVRLAEGIEGLVHLSDMTWDRTVRKPEDMAKAGDEVEVEILNVAVGERRISLSMKRLQENPLSVFAFNHPTGSVVEGTVVRLSDFGAFVELEPGIDGLVHVSNLSEERVENPAQLLKLGDKIKAVVLKVEPDAGKISLSVKDYLKRQEKESMKKFLTEMRSQHGGYNMGELLKNASIRIDAAPVDEARTDG